MRPTNLILGIITFFCLTGVAVVQAQAPALEIQDVPGVASPGERWQNNDSLLSAPVSPREWSVDLVLGLPTGLRAQRALTETNTWHIEGFVGLEYIFPISGGGVRWRCLPICGRRDALAISPGLNAYLLYNILHNSHGFFGGGAEFAGLFTADVDMVWQHAFSDRWAGELGLKLGAGTLVSSHNWGVVPVVGVFTGWRF